MQACKLIMFHYAYTHVLSGVWSGSAANGVLRKRARIGAPVRKDTRLKYKHTFCNVAVPSVFFHDPVENVAMRKPSET